jgi:prevent-host-death family protein
MTQFHDLRMVDREVTVTEASRHFTDLINRTYYRGETTVLIRSGEPVAMVVPVGSARVTGRDWLSKWRSMPHLDDEDAEAFATDLANARPYLKKP